MAKKRQSRITSTSTPTSPVEKVQAEVNFRRDLTKSPDYFSIYANDFQVQTGPWDVRLVFGEIGDSSTEGGIPAMSVRQLGEMRMSPQIAKKLTMILIEQLRTYENRFGEIPAIPV